MLLSRAMVNRYVMVKKDSRAMPISRAGVPSSNTSKLSTLGWPMMEHKGRPGRYGRILYVHADPVRNKPAGYVVEAMRQGWASTGQRVILQASKLEVVS